MKRAVKRDEPLIATIPLDEDTYSTECLEGLVGQRALVLSHFDRRAPMGRVTVTEAGIVDGHLRLVLDVLDSRISDALDEYGEPVINGMGFIIEKASMVGNRRMLESIRLRELDVVDKNPNAYVRKP